MTTKNLVKADLYRIISRGLSYPTEENIGLIKNSITELITSNTIETDLQNILNSINQYADLKELQLIFSRSLMKGTPPTTESYCTQNANSFSDVAAFYSAFGMKAKTGDAPDAITYETEFLSLLLVKYEIAKDAEQKEITHAAYIKFLDEHFNAFSEKYLEKLKQADLHEYYNAMAGLLAYLATEEKELVSNFKTINV